ncbi:adhesion G-protein coupled receptor V1 [Brienomyrus brachyistius]|uniref:adhesion G-protein coupled receptor V1 n=1 Tax=Brienomyrus brachyistius TaxID=42636 RepID=UPI0020B1847F|nr:adhesion G-protein coupled receptor V1 [Brienomyrus brachyistius]XP_048838828.1 adhesion G-protein coupled receptor V1 [Brienomyrus brachyistius]
MPTVLTLVGLFLVTSLPSSRGNSELRFLGQTHFVVNENSSAVVRLVVERIGEPVNITALVLLEGDDTGDFEATTAAAFLLASETNKTIFIAVRDDDLPEPDETFIFNLRLQSSSNGVRLGTPSRATITILSNDNAFGIISFNSSSLVIVDELKGRNQYVPLTLIREKGTYGTVTVNFEISGGPNPPSEDITPDRGNITIPPGRAVVVYSIVIRDDQVPEDDEVFIVQLMSVEGGAQLNPNRSIVHIKINKNDSPIRFAVSIMLVPETVGLVNVTVTRGRDEEGRLIGSDATVISIDYTVISSNGTASAMLSSDFVDLQDNCTLVFPPYVYEVHLHFQIIDDKVPEIAESFQVVLLENTLLGDGVLLTPSVTQVTIEPNDKPYGVLSINSGLLSQVIIINEDFTSRFEGISIVRNGGTHSNVSVNWIITRNSTDRSPVSTDLRPAAGVLRFAAGQMFATLSLNITNDDLPEEAEAFIFRLLPSTVAGGAEVDEPMEMVFYIQDSDDVYGLFRFHPVKEQRIQSQPVGRFISLSFLRDKGTLGDVQLSFTALYIPAGLLDPTRARDGVLNGTRINRLTFPGAQSEAELTLPIRNDAFLQNGAHFLIQLDSLDLVNISPPIPPISPRFAGALNITLTVTSDIANGEIGFISNQTVIVNEPEDDNITQITLPLHRDGTDGQAVVFWSLRPTGRNSQDVTLNDLGPFSGSVTFLSGQSDSSINIIIKADSIPEINETILITLDRTNAENQILKPGFTSREIVITENDDPGGIFEFSPQSRGPWFINEGEAVELKVIRSQGLLLKQLIRYEVIPSGNAEFYGATGILEFNPGEREVVVALVARPDGIPELDEMFCVILSSHSTPPSHLGSAREVNITVRSNDDPFGVIEFILPGMVEAIKESKGSESFSASFPIVRNRGTFGEVSIFWILDPYLSEDISPVQGLVVFKEKEVSKNLTIFSVPDQIPEYTEVFTVILLNATNGARLGNSLNATLQILKNDDPIYFAEPVLVRVQEGEIANFTVLRAGPADFVATVMYVVTHGGTSSGDFIPKINETLVFGINEWSKNISLATEDDDEPETDEEFYITLYNATGDAVVYGADTATVIIEANDDANGIFFLEQVVKQVEEGKSNNFYVLRSRGHFGNVTVYWQLSDNNTVLEPGQEFISTSGSIIFTTGEITKPIALQAISDKLPEFNEYFVLNLVNIKGGYPGPGGRLAETNLNVSVLIPFNDDPFGVFEIDDQSLDLEVAEDVLSEEDMSNVATIIILRQQGTFGDVRVGWEILSDVFPLGLPPMQDLILMASFPRAVELRPHSRRPHSATDALFFPGFQGAYGTISTDNQLQQTQSLSNFTFSAWLVPRPNTDGFIISKGTDNGTFYYGIKIHTNESHVTLMLYYNAVGSNSTQIARSTAAKYVEDNIWLQVIITVDDGIIEFYLDGNTMPGGIKSLKGEAITDGEAPLHIGSDPEGKGLYTGLMQDVRLYSSKLDWVQIRELHSQPAKMDLHNVSGYLEYWQDERRKGFVVEVRDDREEEAEEIFYLQLVSVRGGARLPDPRPTAMLRVLKSDNANGLFGFTGTCIPDISEEGSTISCVVERTRGALDYVFVNYTVRQLDSDSSVPTAPDFANTSGSILFLPGQRSEVLNLLALDDDIPELAEVFEIKLVSAESSDGKPGSSPTSGASIDPDNSATTVTIKASDHPYGLLQFSTLPLTEGMIRPATKEAHLTVMEEDGAARLLVVRAQGLLGRVLVGYRTLPFSAVSPEDYEDTEGVLDFLPGERYKYITVNIVDNPVPELEKIFRVELYNPGEGADQLIRTDGSGSGESDADFFLPSFHQRASLGISSRITVSIAASDDAHGVFQFSPDSLAVNGTEPEEGHSMIIMQVVRSFGDLSNVTVFWEAEPAAEEDLLHRTGELVFVVGQTAANFILQIAEDIIPELDKSFVVTLSNVSHGRLGNLTNANLTILASDDPYGVFEFSEKIRPVRVAEANTYVTLTIKRQRGLLGLAQVTYRTLKDSDPSPFSTPGIGRANERSDFIPLMDSVLFDANQSEANVTLQVLDDEEPERAESIFVELSSVKLVRGVQSRPIYNSPRLGLGNTTVAQVVVEASDDAFGVLQLSSSAVSVAEHYVGPIVNVTRIGGIFADVSVKFQAVPMTARVGDDYSVASSDVVLLEGETSKPVPIYIINDNEPELEETFRIELLNQTTGGAQLGQLTKTVITILPSDDPFGAFVFQDSSITVEEPAFNSTEISLPILRKSGTLGYVSVQWQATVNGKLADGDIRPVSGEVRFLPRETLKTLKVEVLADDVPEIEEIIIVELTSASNGGNIGRERAVNVIVPANDNPYGTVHFDQSVYRLQEPLEGVYLANITVRRSGGHFGRLDIMYRTSEFDVISTALDEGRNLLVYFDAPVRATLSSATIRPVNLTAQRTPLTACAAFCLRETTCHAFSMSNISGVTTCNWVITGVSQLTDSTQVLTYIKNVTALSSLFSSRATAGIDYLPVTSQVATMFDGAGMANLTVPILTDSLPEMDESFMIHILRADLINLTAVSKNMPSVGQPNTARVTIAMNGDAFGIFLLYSLNPSATRNGLYLEVNEEPNTSVSLVIERRGGSLGRVTVEWKFVGGTALPKADFNGTGETLIFAQGDLKKTIEIFIMDDMEPEDNETVMIGLVNTEGGSRILPSSDTVTIVILANDHLAGVVGFHEASRSVTAREGEKLHLLVKRSSPGRGNVTMDWRIQGPRVQQTFVHTSGALFFSEGILSETIVLQLMDDQAPEEKEEYKVILSNILTQGVAVTGQAVLDSESHEALVTVIGSDEPFGVLNIAPSSLSVFSEEVNTTIKIFINREQGASGAINISYETVKGSRQDLALTESALAEPGLDFLSATGSLVMQDGQTSLAIPITIIDDEIPELQECFLINITSAVLISVVASSQKLDTLGLMAEVCIGANDGVRGIIEWKRTDFEVNETQRVLTLVAYRNGGSYGNVSLFFYAQNLEAQLGLDFNVTSSILHFADGERQKSIDVQIIDDSVPEGDENFQLILSNPSFGLQLGHNTTATVLILANDDGHGVITFNNSQHFLLQEPTSSGLGQSFATLYVMRNPPQGTFDTVTVQFHITDANGSLSTSDLVPSEGFVVLEDGERFQALRISAVLDEEPEANETFTVTLFNPTGGARLGDFLQTTITVLQNQAPLGLFRIFPVQNRTSSISVEEGNKTLFMTISRSNGLETAVSVEWEFQSGTAFGMMGDVPVLGVYQNFHETPTSSWCTLASGNISLAMRLGTTGNFFPSVVTLYRWQGAFVPLQTMRIQDPKRCTGFAMDGSSYVVVTHGGHPEFKTANMSLFRLQLNLNLTLEQTLNVEGLDIKYFSVENEHYLIASNQVLVWAGSRFILHQTLEIQEVLSFSLFSRGNALYLAVAVNNKSENCLLYQWSRGQFQNPQLLSPSSSAKQVETFHIGADIYLLMVTDGPNSTCDVFVWSSRQLFFQHFQSIHFPGLLSAHSFTPPSGISHLFLAGSNTSAIFSWRSNQSCFSLMLEAPPTQIFLFLPVPHFNATRSLIASTHHARSTIYELTSISNQSDFIPSSGELHFEPGDSELTIAVNILDDYFPEDTEYFHVNLKNPKGGAEIGFNGQVTIFISSNDDAHGIVGFAQNSLFKEVDELERDNLISLSIERMRGTFGRLIVHWAANGSVEDIFPTSGVTTFLAGQALATITFTVLADEDPELAEKITITLLNIGTIGIDDASRGAVINPERAQAFLIILPNGSPFGVIGWHSDSYYIVTEEPLGKPRNVTLTIVREQGFVGDVAVHYRTRPALSQLPKNQATANEDYIPKDAIAVMKENVTDITITITVLPDDVPELLERFLINISSVELLRGSMGGGQPSLKRPGMEVAEVTIQENDDPRGVVLFNITKDISDPVQAYEVPPPGNLVQLPVARLAGRRGIVVVYWEARPISASFEDFTPASGNVTFQDGQAMSIIEITIIDDSAVELLETFSVTLTQVMGGARLGNETMVTVSIGPNDSPLGLFGFEEHSVTVMEPQFTDDPGSVATLTVVRSPGGRGIVHLLWRLEDTAQDDLKPLNGTLQFNETESKKTLVISALADAVLEGDERFMVHLLAPKNEGVIDTIKGVATIVILGDRGALGTVSIAESSRNIFIGEPQGNYNGTALVRLERGPGIFGEIQVYWNITPAVDSEFEETSGVVTMRDGQSAATIRLKVLDDDVPEERRVYQLILSAVSAEAEISPASRQANLTVTASDFPYGLFSFTQELLNTSEEARIVNITMLRSKGTFNSVLLSYQTVSNTAISGLDFVPAMGQLLFGPGVTLQTVSLEILDDDLPEGPEVFYVNITQVELLNNSNWDFAVKEQGLQLDQPPAIRNVSFIMIVIHKNDNAEGIVEFDPDYINITVEEDVGVIFIPLLRRRGTYGQIMAEYITRSFTALANIDFILPNGSVTFNQGQNQTYINVSIIDDLDREYSEMFEIQLSGATGGAILGRHLVAQITIAKSDSLNGVVRFLNHSRLTIQNPNSTLSLTLMLERTGGLVGETTIIWKILGPNSQEILPANNTDIGEPVNGSFHFRDGEGGVRSIELWILPHGEVEIAETFVVILNLLSGDTDIDAKKGSVMLTIEKFGDPNGIVHFTPEALMERSYNEPSDAEGPLNISLPIMRSEGVMGNITVFWEILSDSDTAEDFYLLRGSVIIIEGERLAKVIVSLLPDSVPELEEVYIIQLSSVAGGAELDSKRSKTQIKVRANDEPHGVFALYPEFQSLEVNLTNYIRYISLNITRHPGTFGNVTADYRITGSMPDQGPLIDAILGSLFMKDGAKFARTTVPLSNQVFFAVGFKFTIELTDVNLIGSVVSSAPRILRESQRVVLTVHEEVANSEVGFESVVLHVSDFNTGSCEALVSRSGLYGDVDVEWRSGYPPGQAPPGVQLGLVRPSSGTLRLVNGEKSEILSFTAALNASDLATYAVYLTAAHANVPGGARLRSHFTLAEVEPLGVFLFSSESRQLVVKEDVKTITLYVQRLFGFRGNHTKLTYKTWDGSAKAGEDFVPVQDGELVFFPHQTSAVIRLSILDDELTEPSETFYVNLTGAEVLSPSSPQAQPRIIPGLSSASITILDNDMASGLLSIGPALLHVQEDSANETGQQRISLRVRRSAGFTGTIMVSVRAYGGKSLEAGLGGTPFVPESNVTWALEGEDFQLESTVISLQEGQEVAEVILLILDDLEPEGQEVFFIYLTDPEGGAQIIRDADDQGFTGFAKIIIQGSDFQNGIVGFSAASQSGLFLDEDSENRTTVLVLQRQENRAFEDVAILWRATFNTSVPSLIKDGVDLTKELHHTTGTAFCRQGEVLCTFTLEIRHDQEPEYQSWFLVEIYQVGLGAAINQSARFANISILESDDPLGLVYFALGSRLPVVHKKVTRLSLQVSRDGGTLSTVSVQYRLQELQRAEAVGPSLIWPAVAGMDFEMAEGRLSFEQGQRSTFLDIVLTPDSASSNPLPKRLQVLLSEATGGARVHSEFGVANVTVVSDSETQAVWALLDQLQQPLDVTILDRVLQGLVNKVSMEVTLEQLTAVLDGLSKVLKEAEQTSLADSSRGLTYNLLCALANPSRLDTRGLSQLAEVAERFAFSLLTGVECGSQGQRGRTVWDSCPYIAIAAYHWYPTQINGHTFPGKNGDYFQLPVSLLKVPAHSLGRITPSACQKVQFTEYSTEHWFLTNSRTMALNDKVFSVSLLEHRSRPLLDSEVVYRIHTTNHRIRPQHSLCLLWNQAAESWLSDDQFCRVVDDSGNFVECACSHFSIYTAFAEISPLSTYNEAFYTSGFICISGLVLAILSHVLCSRFSMFAAKLLTHMMVACLGTQVCYLVSAFRGRLLSIESCSALGLFSHYFHLSQFSWMLVQAVNFWQVLVMNDEHTERRYLLYFLLSWGTPALVIMVLVIVLLGGYAWNIHSVYGLVHEDVCFIPNVYAALCTAALVPLICLVGVLVVFIHAYQVTHQWKAYDDVFRGRTNSAEVPMVLTVFALVSLVWLWGGLHMAYRHQWMLILYVIFNCLLGLYVFVVYFIMHNQLCWPVKASYTVEMNGHGSPDSTFQGSSTPAVAEEISKSTQNLISAMEEVSTDWERASLRPSSQPSSVFKQGPQNGTAYTTEGGFIGTNLATDEESQEFDDLIFALKTGSGLTISDTESIHGSQDGGSVANSQIVELRRIPIADTHL